MNNINNVWTQSQLTSDKNLSTKQLFTWKTSSKPSSCYDGALPNKSLGTRINLIERCPESVESCGNDRAKAYSDRTKHFMQLPAVIVIGLIINPVFGLASFVVHMYAVKRKDQVDIGKRWRRLGTRLYFIGVIVSLGLWAIVFAYHYGLCYANARTSTIRSELKQNISRQEVFRTTVTLSVEEAEPYTAGRTALKSSTSTAKPIVHLTSKSPTSTSKQEKIEKVSYEQFKFELSLFEYDLGVKGIEQQDNRNSFPF